MQAEPGSRDLVRQLIRRRQVCGLQLRELHQAAGTELDLLALRGEAFVSFADIRGLVCPLFGSEAASGVARLDSELALLQLKAAEPAELAQQRPTRRRWQRRPRRWRQRQQQQQRQQAQDTSDPTPPKPTPFLHPQQPPPPPPPQHAATVMPNSSWSKKRLQLHRQSPKSASPLPLSPQTPPLPPPPSDSLGHRIERGKRLGRTGGPARAIGSSAHLGLRFEPPPWPPSPTPLQHSRLKAAMAADPHPVSSGLRRMASTHL